jgi:uncharacterized membrane protein YbhN (UPF0104 family)
VHHNQWFGDASRFRNGFGSGYTPAASIVSQRSEYRWIYANYFLFAAITAYVISQFGFLATLITVSLLLSAILFWRKRRPQDFRMASYLSRVFISLMYALLFFTSYLIVRATQPANYRAEHLAILAIVSVILAIYFGSIGRKSRLVK